MSKDERPLLSTRLLLLPSRAISSPERLAFSITPRVLRRWISLPESSLFFLRFSTTLFPESEQSFSPPFPERRAVLFSMIGHAFGSAPRPFFFSGGMRAALSFLPPRARVSSSPLFTPREKRRFLSPPQDLRLSTSPPWKASFRPSTTLPPLFLGRIPLGGTPPLFFFPRSPLFVIHEKSSTPHFSPSFPPEPLERQASPPMTLTLSPFPG